jgi:hypothetical protein
MRTKIFLASSSELADDRKEFEISINRKNKDWVDRGVFLELELWEDFLDALSKTRLQDEYNRAIRECDIFVMLFSTKVGPYTKEEFETAFGQFQTTNKPKIYTYFKDTEISASRLNKDDLETLWAFQEKLKHLGHFYTTYKNVDELTSHFKDQLDKLVSSGFIKFTDEPHKGGPGSDVSRRTYVDPETGLMWTIRDNGSDVTWPQANDYAQQLRFGGYADWRLPTIDELEELRQSDSEGGIRPPFKVHALMWSSTKSGPDHALFYNFWLGAQGTLPLEGSASPCRAFCVRSAEG